MIQDIAPHRYDNTYTLERPEETDYVLCVQGNKTLLAREEDGTYAIPTLAQAAPLAPGARERAVRLFAIDGRPYFLLEAEDEEEIPLPEGEGFGWKPTAYFRTMQPGYQAFAAITATQIWRWRRSRRFCGRCGTRTVDSRTERALVCPRCGQTEYPKICPAVIVAITNGDKLLMTRYRDRPSTNYALVAGFVEIGETFEETVRREVMEEVGLRVKNIRYFASQPWAFTDTEMIGFFAELDGGDAIRLQEDELAEAGWFTREEIPEETVLVSVGSEMKMAFKHRTWEPSVDETAASGQK